jgi:tripartite motif-containing protein 71
VPDARGMNLRSVARSAALPLLLAASLLVGLTFVPSAGANPWTDVASFGDVGAGEFRAPLGLAADAGGSLYVLEDDMHRVQKLDANGVSQATWGQQGGAEGEFYYPEDIAIDAAAGGVYVADTGNNRVQKFNTNGEFVAAWGWGVADGSAAFQVCTAACRPGIEGNGPGQFNNPTGIATDGVNVYVADPYNKRVEKFDLAGAKAGEWAIPAGQAPQRVAVAGGKVYVTTSANVVWRLDTAGVADNAWDGDGVAGSPGSGPGQLQGPKGLAVDATGVYVVDRGNQRVSKFDLNGAFMTSWGTQGHGDGQFYGPYGILATGGSVWVADTYNHRLQRFSQAGSHQLTVGASPGAAKFDTPGDVAASASGGVYVADSSSHEIERLDASGNTIARWSTAAFAFSVTPTANGVYVPEWGDHVRVYDTAGALLSEFGGTGSALGQFAYPAGSAADAAGNVYVADRANHRIQKFTSAGVPVAAFGSFGSGDGQLNTPRDVAIDSVGNLYASDAGNNRVVKFSPTGQFITKWGSFGSGDGQFDNPHGVAVGPSGHVFVADRDNNRIQQFDASGNFVAKWGSFGNGSGELAGPEGVAVDSDGAVWVADTDNHRIVRFRFAGANAGPEPSGAAQPPAPGGDTGSADIIAPRVKLAGRAVQRLRGVRQRGLALRITTSERTRVALRATLTRRDARRLGLRRATVGRYTTEAGTGIARGIRLRLTPRAQRALVRTRRVRIVVRANVTDLAGNRSRASLAITVVP